MKKEISTYGENGLGERLEPNSESACRESRTASATAQQTDADEYLYLIGQPTLKQFLRFVKDRAVDPEESGDLTEEWQAANNVVSTLEKEEAGLADNPTIEPVSPDCELLLEFLKDPLVRNSFNTVPTEVAYVNLNQMVVYQHHIDLTFVRQLEQRLRASMTEEEVFRFCLPHERLLPPAKWSRLHRDTYVFVSPSNDLRFLGVMPLEAKHIQNYPPPGYLVGVIGLAVGFGSNFMNAIYAEGRLILNNGSHRAYALREMGITRVPCIVQHVSSREELNVLACTAVTDGANFFLKEPRPMMLKDYFDPRLRKIVNVHRRTRQITVKFDVDDGFIPTF
jgi:hypothetical protein